MADMFTGSGKPLTGEGFTLAAQMLKAQQNLASLWSILAVETRGFGFLPDKRPKILFERHIFHQRTNGRFSAAHPDISNPDAGGYSGGAAEYSRLAKAMALNTTAALESASWGLGQIMGFNAKSLGYRDALDMIDKFKDDEDAQLDGCARFIVHTPALLDAFRKRIWDRVAFFYNGKNYAKNDYDSKLQNSYTAYSSKLPDVGVRAMQARLAYVGFNPKGIDGVVGKTTTDAILGFQRKMHLDTSGQFDPATSARLIEAAGV